MNFSKLFCVLLVVTILAAPSKAATPSKTKSKTPTKAVVAPSKAPSGPTAPPAVPTTATTTGAFDYTISIALDAKSPEANGKRSEIEVQCKSALKARLCSVSQFAAGKFSIQDVVATLSIDDAVASAAEAMNTFKASGYKLGGFSVKSATQMNATPSPGASLTPATMISCAAAVVVLFITAF